MYSSTHYSTSALGGGEWSASRPGCLTPRERAPRTLLLLLLLLLLFTEG
jgi:hypothetical protein